MEQYCLICREVCPESEMESVAMFGVPDVCKDCWNKIPEAERYRLTIEHSDPEHGGSSFKTLCKEMLKRLHSEDWFQNITKDGGFGRN